MKEELKEYFDEKTITLLVGKKDKRNYPAEMGEEALNYACEANGKPKTCPECGGLFKCDPPYRVMCQSCVEKSFMDVYDAAEAEEPGEMVHSLTWDTYYADPDEAFDAWHDEYDSSISEEDTARRMRLVNPTPNYASPVDWEDISYAAQPEGRTVEPSEHVADLIHLLNKAIAEMPPLSWGPGWETKTKL